MPEDLTEVLHSYGGRSSYAATSLTVQLKLTRSLPSPILVRIGVERIQRTIRVLTIPMQQRYIFLGSGYCLRVRLHSGFWPEDGIVIDMIYNDKK